MAPAQSKHDDGSKKELKKLLEPPFKYRKDWGTSLERQGLIDDIFHGLVTSDSDPWEVYEMHEGRYYEFDPEAVQKSVKTLTKSFNKEVDRTAWDQWAYQQDSKANPPHEFHPISGALRWDGSQAEKDLHEEFKDPKYAHYLDGKAKFGTADRRALYNDPCYPSFRKYEFGRWSKFVSKKIVNHHNSRFDRKKGSGPNKKNIWYN